MPDTEINDLFWFDSDTIREWLDLPTEEQEEQNEGIEEWEEENPEFVEWVLDTYFFVGDRNDMNKWGDILEYLNDEDIQQAFVNEQEEEDENNETND